MYLQGQMSTSIVRNPFWLVSYNQTTQINYLLIYNSLLFTVCPKNVVDKGINPYMYDRFFYLKLYILWYLNYIHIKIM